MTIDRSHAEALDAEDPLARYREDFVIDDDRLIYLDGNSLGRLTRAGRERVIKALEDDWGRHLIRSWTERWTELPFRIGDLIGTQLLGADPGEVTVGDSTTVSLYKAMSALLDAQPDRRAVVIERGNFPTDRYLVEGIAAQRQLDIRWIDETGPDGVRPEHVTALLDDQVALIVLSHVDYRSAAWLDMAAITTAAHDAGALTLWDVCHAVGAVPIDVHRDDVDVAVGCTYKYLNGGPGSPAFTYVRADLQARLRQPIWGWWGRQDTFDMAQGYEPQPGMGGWLTGTPSVLSMVAVEPAVAMIAEAGMEAVRAKSVALTSLLVDLYDAWLVPLGFELASPRDASRRGSHVTVTRRDAIELVQTMTAAGVVPDFRRSDGIRLGLAPLTTRFVDVYDAMARLVELAD
jgi:kynureninase